ncbi:hypothetical protein R3X27_12595 [Tropicimonas sp. TH_r6]|uniref:hypothetical protein n=1 Tax=Tropicimonas sp. TH_r6 TaxID=3082085 RepID=UPI002953BE2D|nr:hypothetical protein [Tropicimonas sp. TH_r6]MDV7143519.1 hypothetical protein [Tropicimonas sp. TH_r6]
MAEDIRQDYPGHGDLSEAHGALCSECAQQSRNAVYTSTTFFIWLRWLKRIRGSIWIAAVISSTAAASAAISKQSGVEVIVAGLALLGVILPGVIKALKLDETIKAYEESAAAFKRVEGRLRRAAEVWSHKPFADFEVEARTALTDLETAQIPSLTPPEWCFRAAQRKVRSGDYDPDP